MILPASFMTEGGALMEITTRKVVCAIMGVTFASYFELIQKMDSGVLLLVVLMGIDYLMGLFIAMVLKKSKKTSRGACSSCAAFAGLAKKGTMLAFCLIGTLLDRYLNQTFFLDAIAVAFIMNELISVVENAGIMGVPIPGVIKDALETLNKRQNQKPGKK